MMHQSDPARPMTTASSMARGSRRSLTAPEEASFRLCITAFIMLVTVSPIHTVLKPRPVMFFS